jgi:uncharacterized metal-binding protein YceD (DUF177 family)
MPTALSWEHWLEDIPTTGLTVERVADAGERQLIAAALDLNACCELSARYHIAPLSLDRYRLTGELTAKIEQTCVVTLEPVAAVIADNYAATYWPEAAMPEPAAGQLDLNAAEPEPEPIVGGKIDVGRIIFESLAAAIDPFPRRPGAVFEGPLSAPTASEAESPFAVLASLKDKR